MLAHVQARGDFRIERKEGCTHRGGVTLELREGMGGGGSIRAGEGRL